MLCLDHPVVGVVLAGKETRGEHPGIRMPPGCYEEARGTKEVETADHNKSEGVIWFFERE